MFVESKKAGEGGGRFDAWARAHPAWMNVLLVALAVAAAGSLLFLRGYSFVLYQGF